MKLAKCHVEFMQTRAYPRFAARVLSPGAIEEDRVRRAQLINRCVNAHFTGPTPFRESGYALQNMLALLALWRKNQARIYSLQDREMLADYLATIALFTMSDAATLRRALAAQVHQSLNLFQ